jgi:hypothetical protein
LYVNDKTRKAQDSIMLYNCVMNSLTDQARLNITNYEDEFIVDGKKSGTCLLKVVIANSHIDTKATTMHIRHQLASLDVHMVRLKSDVLKLNIYVIELLSSLEARGEKSYDVLSFLFKGYKAAVDERFVEYIQKKEDDFLLENTEMTVDSLMKMAKI